MVQLIIMGDVKITYLLGAGASAEALPTIKSTKKKGDSIPDKEKGLPESLMIFIEEYYQQWSNKTINGVNEVDEEYLKIHEKLKIIAQSCIDFGTPDLFAKFLNASVPFDSESYTLLKLLMSNYFTLKQYSDSIGRAAGHGALDKRALTFLSTICEEGKLPKNVNLLSWNYDEQIEISGKKINSNNNFITSWPNQNPDYKGDYFLVHLNGIAGWDYDLSPKQLPREFTTYKNFNTVRNPLLSFAWEKKENMDLDIFFQQRLPLIEKTIRNTKILVIIGYSFPFFNRKIDKEIFKRIDPDTKIYYQDPAAEIKIPVIRKLFGIRNEIEPITYLEQYYVPFEL